MAESIGLISVLLIALLCMSIIVIFLFIRQKRFENKSRLLVDTLRAEIQAMSGSTIGMGKRIVDIENKLDVSIEKQIELEQRDPDEVAYSQAARLVEMLSLIHI